MNDGTGLNSAGLLPSRIKRIQRGTITLSGTTSGTATITAVDTSKTVLNNLGCSFDTLHTTLAETNVRIALTNSTTITATRANAAGGGVAVVSYEAIEYA